MNNKNIKYRNRKEKLNEGKYYRQRTYMWWQDIFV